MAYHMPETKVEEAFRRYIEANRGGDLDGVTIMCGFEGSNKTPLILSIIAAESEPWPAGGDNRPYTGSWLVSVQVALVSHYKEMSGATHDQTFGAVCDLLLCSDVVTQLNAAMAGEQFTAILWTFGTRTRGVDEHEYITTISGQLAMMPAAAT